MTSPTRHLAMPTNGNSISLPGILLKVAARDLCVPVCHIFNSRPISLLQVLSKILERIVFNLIQVYFINNELKTKSSNLFYVDPRKHSDHSCGSYGDLNKDKDKKCYEPGNDITRATRVGGVRYFSNAPACLFNNLYNRYANCLWHFSQRLWVFFFGMTTNSEESTCHTAPYL